MILSQKQTFSEFVSAFLKSRLNFEHFDKKNKPHRFCISEITDSQSLVRLMSKKSSYRGPFDNQHGEWAIILWNYASQQFYHSY